jgi:GAF domain-containing protein
MAERAPLPANETQRMLALRSHGILDTVPEQEFEDAVALASALCGTPMALVSLVDAERQWFKARVGLEVAETPRDDAFCAHTILNPHGLVVTDALQDPRFYDNPLVLGGPCIRFYAGFPLITEEGFALGTLNPGSWTRLPH